MIPIPEGTAPKKSVLLVRRGDRIAGFWNVCQHLPIPLDGGTFELPPAGDLVCVTHGARYEATTGQCRAGPCEGARLEEVSIRVEGDVIVAPTLPPRR